MSKDKYYYNHVDGRVALEIKVGQNGVTQEHIDVLLEIEAKAKTRREYLESKEVAFDDKLESVIGTYDGFAADGQEPEQNSMEELLRSCVERLKPEQQELYYAVMGMRKTYEEVATEKGITRQSVYGQMQTVKKKLKKMLEESEMTDLY